MANVDILIEALKNIQSYGQGVCPDLAKKALVDYGNAEFADSQQAVETDGPYFCECGDKAEYACNLCVYCGGYNPTA